MNTHINDDKILAVRRFLLNLQDNICQALEDQEQAGGVDGASCAKFVSDVWERPDGDSGHSNVLSDGMVI